MKRILENYDKSIKFLLANGFSKIEDTDYGVYANDWCSVALGYGDDDCIAICNANGDASYLHACYYAMLGNLVSRGFIPRHFFEAYD